MALNCRNVLLSLQNILVIASVPILLSKFSLLRIRIFYIFMIVRKVYFSFIFLQKNLLNWSDVFSQLHINFIQSIHNHLNNKFGENKQISSCLNICFLLLLLFLSAFFLCLVEKAEYLKL